MYRKCATELSARHQKQITGGKLGPDMPMWGMMANFNMETLMTMMGSAPESAMTALNKQLNAFDLVD